MIALVTEIPRFYYSVTKELNSRGIEFLSLNLNEEIPSNVKVVLTSIEEKKLLKFQNVVADTNAVTAVEECLRILKGLDADYAELVIGIDPGAKPGIAVLGDGRVALAERLNSPEEVLGSVKKILNLYSGKKILFKVGEGGGIYKMRVLKSLQDNFQIPIETVDENNTTPVTSGMEPALKDIMAAVSISAKHGKRLNKKVALSLHMGEIKNVQRESRALSGIITISKELAEKVAKGEITLEEAVRLHTRK